MDFLEVAVYTSTAGIEPVTGVLLQLGVTGFVVEDSQDFLEFLEDKNARWDYVDDSLMTLKDQETCVKVYLPRNQQGVQQLEGIHSELERLKGLDREKQFGRLELSLANVKEEDWANNWKAYFKPFPVGNRLAVKPTWEQYDNPEGRLVLEIDPSSSFGTGQHHTTQLCLGLLEECVTPGCGILDMGCGSGILGIGALLLGAGHVTAVDIEENAVRIAGENYQQNHIFPEQYTVCCADVLGNAEDRERICGTEYDLVVANIVADIIIAMTPLFARCVKRSGTLVVSGIILERAEEVLSVLRSQGFCVEEVREQKGWAAAKLRR